MRNGSREMLPWRLSKTCLVEQPSYSPYARLAEEPGAAESKERVRQRRRPVDQEVQKPSKEQEAEVVGGDEEVMVVLDEQPAARRRWCRTGDPSREG
jgi:hypothetical protein